MTRPLDVGRPIVISRRWDQLGGRLSAIVNAAALAERLELEARFVWPRGLDEIVNDPTQLFSPEYLEAHEIEAADLDEMEVVAFDDLGDEQPGDGVCVDVDLIFDAIRIRGETDKVAHERFLRCWHGIGWSDAVRELMRRCDDALAGFSGAGLHVRAGDIIEGDWRHVVGHEKYTPTPYVEHAVATLSIGGRRILVLSDNAPYLAWLAERYSSVVTAAELVPGYAELPEVHQAFVDILALSRCERILGPPFSAFSRLAALVGGQPFTRADELVASDAEPGFLLGALKRQGRALEAEDDPTLPRLLARDTIWCVDVFAEDLPADTLLSLARTAADLDPDFASAAAHIARLAALAGQLPVARAAAATARAEAATVHRHDDPMLDALATSIVLACAEVATVGPPRMARVSARRASGWADAERTRVAALIADAERDLATAATLHPFWTQRDRVLEALSALIATAAWLGDQSPTLRRRVARAVRKTPPVDPTMRLAGLTAHRQEPMFDPLGRELTRIVARIFSAVLAAQAASAT